MVNILKPLATALAGKGPFAFLKRILTIGWRYGLTTAKMDYALEQLSAMLQEFDCRATLPITATALANKGTNIQKYQAQGIEFAAHGYRHIDSSQLSLAEQITHFHKAKQIFQERGIRVEGFRSPYLRCNENTMAALNQTGLNYDSTPSLIWDIDQKHISDNYLKAIEFYGTQPAKDYLALPYLDEANNLVRIPYCLPDDESLIERLKWDSPSEMNQVWPAMFHQIHQQGELFTLGLHPERTLLCLDALTATLQEVAAAGSEVWRAQLGEIAAWWKARYTAAIDLTEVQNNLLQLTVNGPEGTTMLLRSLKVHTSTTPWFDGYQRATEFPCTICIDKRPFIGISPDAELSLISFLRQQGYIIETSSNPDSYAFYIDAIPFSRRDERRLVTQIEQADFPLIRFGRWPNDARSAFNVTGDIDALSIWDYILRLFGK